MSTIHELPSVSRGLACLWVTAPVDWTTCALHTFGGRNLAIRVVSALCCGTRPGSDDSFCMDYCSLVRSSALVLLLTVADSARSWLLLPGIRIAPARRTCVRRVAWTGRLSLLGVLALNSALCLLLGLVSVGGRGHAECTFSRGRTGCRASCLLNANLVLGAPGLARLSAPGSSSQLKKNGCPQPGCAIVVELCRRASPPN